MKYDFFRESYYFKFVQTLKRFLKVANDVPFMYMNSVNSTIILASYFKQYNHMNISFPI